ncbi:MAG: sulfatase-like hydrolase/transferase, partial [Burkholderiaceae bacterium]
LDALINSFDNSVLYVDTMLSELLDILRDKKAIVFYTSDHGESLSENMHFHATPRKKAPAEQFRVPYLVWMSDSFKTASPANEQAFANSASSNLVRIYPGLRRDYLFL